MPLIISSTAVKINLLTGRRVMSKKTKKSQMAENQESTNQMTEGNKMEVINHTTEEATPLTIVEATETDIFVTQTEGQEAAVITEGKGQVVESTMATTEGEAVEKPAPAKKERVSKRPYISLVEEHLELGDLDKKELLALIMEQFPTVSKTGASTFLTDALNPRYSHWKEDRVVSKTIDGKLIFADKIEPLPEDFKAPVQTTQPEQPSE
jgi:predicted extracellular nuclease